jgi:hypothetical protein
MNFNETLQSAALVVATDEVPLIVGESGIGKTALAKTLARQNQWACVVIDGNLLKEGEIGGLPIVQNGVTTYAIHHKLKEIEQLSQDGQTVLLFIDEINRCEHTVQQELMNLILNREINGYHLPKTVKILSAMNPSGTENEEFDYQVVDMDAAQENRFVWLFMESDVYEWTKWAIEKGLEPEVVQFISTFPTYLYQKNPGDRTATPRSYERISKAYAYYKSHSEISRLTFLNVVRGNVGKVIAQAFMHFIESPLNDMLDYEMVMASHKTIEQLKKVVENESPTRLYVSAKNILIRLEKEWGEGERHKEKIKFFIGYLNLYPWDLKLALMKEMRNYYPKIYEEALELPEFIEAYFEMFRNI